MHRLGVVEWCGWREEAESRVWWVGGFMYNTILVLVVSKVFGIIKDQAPADRKSVV